jgi:hypothetical protein
MKKSSNFALRNTLKENGDNWKNMEVDKIGLYMGGEFDSWEM